MQLTRQDTSARCRAWGCRKGRAKHPKVSQTLPPFSFTTCSKIKNAGWLCTPRVKSSCCSPATEPLSHASNKDLTAFCQKGWQALQPGACNSQLLNSRSLFRCRIRCLPTADGAARGLVPSPPLCLLPLPPLSLPMPWLFKNNAFPRAAAVCPTVVSYTWEKGFLDRQGGREQTQHFESRPQPGTPMPGTAPDPAVSSQFEMGQM